MPKPSLCFAGTPEFAAAHLAALIEDGFEIKTVYTQPDRRAGRGKKLQASPVKRVAEAHNLAVRQPRSLRDSTEVEALRSLAPDVLVVVAYGLILPAAILKAPTLACINVHASLLPRWRGAAPIERALLAGDTETGVTIMLMDEGLDTGDMLSRVVVPISGNETTLSLEAQLTCVGPGALIDSLNNLSTLMDEAEKQDDSLACYAAKVEKSEAVINWENNAFAIDRQVRAGIGRFPAWSMFNNDRLRILEAQPVDTTTDTAPGTIFASDDETFTVACQNSSLRVMQIQLPGKNPVAVRSLLNSRPELFAIGKQFASPAGEQ